MADYILSDEESKRISIIKLIGMIFVVFIHSYTENVNFSDGTMNLFRPMWLDMVEYVISQIISRCGVPLFFLISAVLLYKKERKYISTLKTKVRTLFVPYLIWNTFWILIFLLLQSMPYTSTYFSGSNTLIKDCNIMDWLQLYGIGPEGPQDYPLWFMRDLMIVTLIFPLINKIVEKYPKCMMVLTITVLFLSYNFPLKTALCWNIIGACVVHLNIRMRQIDHFPFAIISILYAALVVAELVLHYFNISSNALHTVMIFSGIIFWIRITKFIYINGLIQKYFLKIAQYTFILFVAHELTLSCVKKVCIRILPTMPIVLLLEYIFIPFFIITLCCILAFLLKKYVPKQYEIITGKR